jgi:hypothetical protein
MFSFGSGGGGGGGSSDISRYRLHVEPANAGAAAAASGAGLQILSSNLGKSTDPPSTGPSGPWTNRLKPALPHAWMESGNDKGAMYFVLWIACLWFSFGNRFRR